MTTQRIHVLDPLVANQIAAGEVIERPASVVKELVENSLDAGATRVEVEVHKGGLQSIQVRDNGTGIHQEDLPLAILRHGTSKISSLPDLTQIHSLGFRGEALASIAAVAKIRIRSATIDSPHAWQLEAEGVDSTIAETPIAHPVGTTITVRDLFFNVPARRKFLRTEKTEFTHIEEVVRRIALSHFEVSFQLQHNDKILFNLPAATTTLTQEKRLAQLCSRAFLQQAVAISQQATGLTLQGWLALPDYSRSHMDQQYFFLNGRVVRDKLLNHGVRQAYQEYLEPRRFPAHVLFLECDPSSVDVNVHPTKHEVRFHESRFIHDFVFSAVHKSLQQAVDGVITEHADSTGEQVALSATASQSNNQLSTQPSDQSSSQLSTRSAIYCSHKPRPAAVKEQMANYAQLAEQPRDCPPQATSSESKPTMHLEPLGCIAQQFMLAKSEQQLLIVDLRKALALGIEHWLQKTLAKSSSAPSQALLFPQTIFIHEQPLARLQSYQPVFSQLGFDIEIIGQTQLMVRQLPKFLQALVVETFFQALQLPKNNEHFSEPWQAMFINVAATHTKISENTVALKKLWQQFHQQLPSKAFTSMSRELSADDLSRILSHG